MDNLYSKIAEERVQEAEIKKEIEEKNGFAGTRS